MKKYHKTANKELCIKFALAMTASILLIFVVVTILNYAAKQYLRQTISRKYSHSWQNEMRKNVFYAETCDNFFGDIVKAEWLSSIELTPAREQKFNQVLAAMLNFITFKHLNEDFKIETIEDADSMNKTEYVEDKKNSTSYCYGPRLWFSRPIKYIR